MIRLLAAWLVPQRVVYSAQYGPTLFAYPFLVFLMSLHLLAYHPFLTWHDMCDRWPPGSVTLIHSTYKVLVCRLTSVLKLAFGLCRWYVIVTISLCCAGSRGSIHMCSLCCMCRCFPLLTVSSGAVHSSVYTCVLLPSLNRICVMAVPHRCPTVAELYILYGSSGGPEGSPGGTVVGVSVGSPNGGSVGPSGCQEIHPLSDLLHDMSK